MLWKTLLLTRTVHKKSLKTGNGREPKKQVLDLWEKLAAAYRAKVISFSYQLSSFGSLVAKSAIISYFGIWLQLLRAGLSTKPSLIPGSVKLLTVLKIASFYVHWC